MSKVNQEVDFTGIEIKFGGKVYIMPPLGLGTIRKRDFYKRIPNLHKKMTEIKTEEERVAILEQIQDECLELFYAALKRNYPDIKKDDIEDALDTDNLNKIYPHFMSMNNLLEDANVKKGK